MSDYPVTVCDRCRRASCWHGEFMCDGALNAGVVDVPVSVLREEDREHEYHFSPERIEAVTGTRPHTGDGA